MTAPLRLLPVPQGIRRRLGTFAFSRGRASLFTCGVSIAAQHRCLAALGRRLGNVRMVNRAGEADIKLILESHLPIAHAARDDVADQAYCLDINEQGVVIKSRSERGLFFGVQTLLQMARQTPELQACAVGDWPDMPVRAIHLTGEGNIPRYEKMKELLDILAEYKVTHVVFEYDNRFAFERYPALNHPAAFTKDQLRELIAFAADRYMEIIPCLDSLGHAEAYLVHDEFRRLAELRGNIHEMCPSNPRTLRFIKELWTEILEVHAGCKFAHITGDEVFRLGAFCPQCAKHARAGTLSTLYCNYYADLAAWIVERGRRPMMWADMVLTHPQTIAQLPKDIIFNDWDYNGSNTAYGKTLRLWHDGEFMPDERRDVPKAKQKLFERHYTSHDGRHDYEPFPFLGFLRDHGFDVMGASSASNVNLHLAMPDFKERIANNRLFCAAIKKAKALGILNTTWTLPASIHASMHGILAGPAYGWHSLEEPEGDYLRNFEKTFMGQGTHVQKMAPLLDDAQLVARGYDMGVLSPAIKQINIQAHGLQAEAQTAPSDCARIYGELVALNADMAQQHECLRNILNAVSLAQIGRGDDQPVDLGPYVNSVGRMRNRSGSFREMGAGKKRTWGISFILPNPAEHKGRYAVAARSSAEPHNPEKIHIPFRRACRRLFFLNAGAWGPMGGIDGIYRMHYADGATAEMKLIVGQNIMDWSGGPRNERWRLLKNAVPAWEGRKTYDVGPHIRAYMSWWDNPRPDVPLRSIEIVATDGPGFSFLFGLTSRASDSSGLTDIKNAKRLLRDLDGLTDVPEKFIARFRKLYARVLFGEDVARSKEYIRLQHFPGHISFARESLKRFLARE